MALLTEEQIKEILLIIENELNVEWSETMFKMLCEWNEKQTSSTQFEPDWSKAPEGTDSVIIKSYWVDDGIWSFGQNVAKYDRPKPVTTPHPHAEIMAKYAEVAARRIDPWVEFELSYCDEDWIALETPTFFDTHLEYRHIGDNK